MRLTLTRPGSRTRTRLRRARLLARTAIHWATAPLRAIATLVLSH